MNFANVSMTAALNNAFVNGALFNSNPMVFNSNPMAFNSNPMLDNSNPMIASGPMPGISEKPQTDWMLELPVRADRFGTAADMLARFNLAS